jgi:hypothetical protein
VNWTVGKRSRQVVYRRRRDEALAWQLRVLFALSRCTELGPVHMQNCDSMISRKERQVLGKKSVSFNFFNYLLEPAMATQVDGSKVRQALSLPKVLC